MRRPGQKAIPYLLKMKMVILQLIFLQLANGFPNLHLQEYGYEYGANYDGSESLAFDAPGNNTTLPTQDLSLCQHNEIKWNPLPLPKQARSHISSYSPPMSVGGGGIAMSVGGGGFARGAPIARLHSGFSSPIRRARIGGTAKAGRNIGLSVGGAKDINSFRENIKNGYLPLPSDVTYEGLFYDYFFDQSKPTSEVCDMLFCPSFSGKK